MLRLVLAVSLDGRLAPPAGGAAQLGGSGDRRALEEALAWADGTLIGAETLRRHGSTCLIHHADLLAQRHRRGLAPQPTALVVSRSCQFSPQLPFWKQPLDRWLVTPETGSLAVAALDGPPLAFRRRIPLQSWPQVLAALAAAGLERVVLLGGAALAGSLLAADLVDELQLTLCPLLLGGPHCWLPADRGLPEPELPAPELPDAGLCDPVLPAPWLVGAGWQLLEQRPLGGDELLVRYGRRLPVKASVS